jgi:puromycin-sensitive aminopeptidase
MERKLTTSHDHEWPIARRETLRRLARSLAILLVVPSLMLIRKVLPAPSQAATVPATKGEHMTQPSQQTDDPYRLPRHVLPVRYELQLEPDLGGASFHGRVKIAAHVVQPTSVVVFNALELGIEEAMVEDAQGERQPASIALDTALQRCTLTVSEPLRPGHCRFDITFRGTLNDKLRGFYRSTYKDEHGATQTLAATQFEATDARRAFPCWDEPDFKAVFSSTLVIDADLTAVSNSAVLSETREAGKKIVRFADTMKMSTYLVAFIVGRLEPSAPTSVGKTALRLWSVPEKRHLTGFGQEIATASLRFFEDYYGIPYPGDKLDLLAIPDFASGAMENLGAITFRETALLVDPRTATHGELERVADVVAHENAHMWFGDLVTMSWWNGLWLNEAFATFMEMLAVDAWKSEWKRWDTFGVSRAAALSVDGLHSTRPIEYAVRAPMDADAMFDVLTYEKGASVLRMLEQHIGPSVFRDGVRDYLRTHAYGNADTKDLWISLGKAARQAVPALMDGWIFQPGYPLLTAELTERSELVLTQQRFSYLSDPAAGLWQVPVQLRIQMSEKTDVRRLLLRNAREQVACPPTTQFVVVNDSGHGFYRVRYGPRLLERLLDAGLKTLAPIERFNLINDSWACTVAGLMPVAAYLELTGRFTDERDKNVWAILIDSFSFLNRVIDPSHRPVLEAFVRTRVSPAVSAVGWTPQSGENDLTRQLRSELIGALGRLGNDPGTQTRAVEFYATSRKDPGAVDPNLLPALVGILAFTGDEARYEEFAERFKKAVTPQEERRYLFSLAMFRQPALLDRTLAKTLDGEIRVQDAPFMVSAVMGNVYGREQGWRFVRNNWDLLDRRFPKQGLRRMCGGITGLCEPELERDVRQFFESRKIDLGGKTLEQYLEQLRIAVSFAERHLRKLPEALQAIH